MAREHLSTRVFHKWLLPALCDWVVIVSALAAGVVADHFIVWLAATVIVGNRQHALGILGHDGAHFAAAKSKRINDIASELLCFWPLGISVVDFRRFHFNHHRYFNTDKDPELIFKSWSRSQWSLPVSESRLVGLFLLDLIGFGVWEMFKAYFLFGRNSLWSWLGPPLWWGAVGGFLYFYGLGFVIVIWFAALGTSLWAFHRLRTWTEHVGTASTHRLRANWWQRILITPHGSWSHFEHHANPTVPFWRRHELRKIGAATVNLSELLASLSAPAGHAESLSTRYPVYR